MNDLTIYNEIRSKMRSGDLLQWKSNSMIGSVIRWKTRKDRRHYEIEHDIDVNHSSIVIVMKETESDDLRVFTNEALKYGTVPNFLSVRLRDFDGHVWLYQLDDSKFINTRPNISRRAFELLGVPYDYKAIVRQFVNSVPAIDTESLYCNEYYMSCLGISADRANNPNWLPNLNIFKTPVKIL